MYRLTRSLKELLDKDPDLHGWYNNVREGSQPTAETYLYWLARCARERGMSVDQLVEEGREDEKAATDAPSDYVQETCKRFAPRCATSSSRQ